MCLKLLVGAVRTIRFQNGLVIAVTLFKKSKSFQMNPVFLSFSENLYQALKICLLGLINAVCLILGLCFLVIVELITGSQILI
jgi:hypothetical protein